MSTITISFVGLVNFTRQRDLDKVQRIKLLMEGVINSSSFKSNVLTANFKDRRFKDDLGNERKISNNEEILKIIESGKEQYRDEPIDAQWDLSIVLYRSWTREVGHRSRETIFTKKRKFRKFTDQFIASHWIHEYMHVLGFRHDYDDTERRAYSIPYLVGDIAHELLTVESNKGATS